MADDGYVTIDLREMTDRADFIFIGALQSDTEQTIVKKIENADLKCHYLTWKIEKIIKGQGKVKLGDQVMVFGPRQFMEFSRALKYKKTGLNQGILVTNYIPASALGQPITGEKRLVFVYGDSPDYLVLVAEDAFESIALETTIQKLLTGQN